MTTPTPSPTKSARIEAARAVAEAAWAPYLAAATAPGFDGCTLEVAC